MKICFFNCTMQAGGAERQIAEWSNYLVALDHDVSVLTMDDKPSFYQLEKSVCHVNLDLIHKSKNIIDAVTKNISNIKKIHLALAQINPDVVVCLGINYFYFACLARKGLKYKVVGNEVSNPFAKTKGFWNKNRRRISKKCDGYIFQTEGAKSYFPKKVQEKACVLPNCIVPERFSAVEKNWQERTGVLAAGRLIESKCFDDLIKAFSIVHKNYPEATLDIYGDGDKREELETLAKTLELDGVVNFKGRSSDMYINYANHKIFAMTSRLEGLPNVLVEALASGCACVSVDCQFGPSELINDGENGLLVPVHDIEGVAKGIMKLLLNDEYARQLGESAKDLRQTHSANTLVLKLVDYLQQVIDR